MRIYKSVCLKAYAGKCFYLKDIYGEEDIVKKRLLGMLLSFAIVFSMGSTLVFADSTEECTGDESCTHAAKIGSVHYDTLDEAIKAVKSGETITLLKDYAYDENGKGLLNIGVSCTLDGNGNTISGWGNRGGNGTTLAINNGGKDKINVTLKDLNISNGAAAGRPVETRGNIGTLTLERCNINMTGEGNAQGLTIGGSQSEKAVINFTDTNIDAGNAGYPIIVFNPIDLNMNGGSLSGYCGIYFKGESGSVGSRGSDADINGTEYNCPNIYSGESNDFGVFAFEDDGITVDLEDCAINGMAESSARQSVFMLSAYSARMEQPVETTVSGNSNVKGILLDDAWKTDNPFVAQISGGTFNDDNVIMYASENVIKFRNDYTEIFFVGTAEAVNHYVADNAITELSIMKAVEGAGFAFPAETKISNAAGVDIEINGELLADGEDITIKKPVLEDPVVPGESDGDKVSEDDTPAGNGAVTDNDKTADDNKVTDRDDTIGRDSSADNVQSPETGDDFSIFVPAITAMSMLIAMAALIRRKRNR